MMLHMLFGSAQLENCLALLKADDTLMVIDSGALASLTAAIAMLPADKVVLEGARSGPNANQGFALIDTEGWLELICQYPHSVSWC